MGATVGDGAGAGVSTGVDATLGANHDINQLGETVGADAGVGTTLGAHREINHNIATAGSNLGSRRPRKSLSKKTRKSGVNNKSRDDSGNVKLSTSQLFVDIASI